jgi:K+ potassium transporter
VQRRIAQLEAAAAYGIGVSATMLMTSALLLIAMREILQWSLPASIGVAGIFLVVDAAFFVSNSLKIIDGGYVPLLLAGGVYTMMFVWHRGADAITQRIHESLRGRSRRGDLPGAKCPQSPERCPQCAGMTIRDGPESADSLQASFNNKNTDDPSVLS